MKRFLSIVLLVLAGIIVNAQAYKVNPSHISSSDARGSETVVFTNNSNTSIDFELKAVETSQGTTPATTKAAGEDKDSAESLYEFLENQPGGVSWMSITPTSGTVAPGQSIQLTVSFNATDISKVLSAHILVTTNDQLNPRMDLSVNLFESASRANCVYFTGTDNENNANTGTPDFDMDVNVWDYDSFHPIEFNIFVDETNITSAQLSIYCFDVDETSGERDDVYINGNFLGSLTGANQVWSTSVFVVPVAYLNPGPNGKNTIQIIVDVNFNGNWVTRCDWGQIVVNDCSDGTATIRYVNPNASCVDPGSQLCFDIEVDTELDPSQSVRVEYNLLDENDINIAGNSYSYATPGPGQVNDPFNRCFTIPANATPGSTYSIQVIVYDSQTYLQEDIEIVPIGIAPCIEPVPVSNWALVIGIALILTFAVIRFRRMI